MAQFGDTGNLLRQLLQVSAGEASHEAAEDSYFQPRLQDVHFSMVLLVEADMLQKCKLTFHDFSFREATGPSRGNT